MIRRLKKDILKQLPPKTRSINLINVQSAEKAAELSDLLNQIRDQEQEIMLRKSLKATTRGDFLAISSCSFDPLISHFFLEFSFDYLS